MENMKNATLTDNELNAAAGGSSWLTQSDRVKMFDGSVCSECGHAIGHLEPTIGYAFVICEKCGHPIGVVPNQSFVYKV